MITIVCRRRQRSLLHASCTAILMITITKTIITTGVGGHDNSNKVLTSYTSYSTTTNNNNSNKHTNNILMEELGGAGVLHGTQQHNQSF